MYQFLREAERLIKPEVPANRILFYSEWQDVYDQMLRENLITKAIEGVPTLEKMKELAAPFKRSSGSLFIVDDGFNEINETIQTMFVQGRHWNCSVLFVTQTLYHHNKMYRNMHLNAAYVTIFPNFRDQSQIRTMSQQMSPYRANFIVEAFQRATKLPYSYLLIDLRNYQADVVRYRTRMFEHEFPPVSPSCHSFSW